MKKTEFKAMSYFVDNVSKIVDNFDVLTSAMLSVIAKIREFEEGRKGNNMVKDILESHKVYTLDLEIDLLRHYEKLEFDRNLPVKTDNKKLLAEVKEKVLSWNHRFSDPKICGGKFGSHGAVIDYCELDEFVKHIS